VVKVFKMILKN